MIYAIMYRYNDMCFMSATLIQINKKMCHIQDIVAFVSFSKQLSLYFIAGVNSHHFTKYLGTLRR